MEKFQIQSVVDLDLPDSRKRKSGMGYVIDCPFCGGKQKLQVRPDKNVWHCAKCDAGGGAIKLHAMVKNISQKEASNELKELLLKQKVKKFVEKPEDEDKTVRPADILIRNTVNRRLLDNLSLNDCDLKDLQRRGLTADDIKSLGYKSYFGSGDDARMHELAADLFKPPFPIKKRDGVPGVRGIGTESVTFVPKKPGYLIPVRTTNGSISAFQIRYNKVEGDMPRYTWLSSSGYDDGCPFTGCENIHHSGDWTIEKMPDTVCLTEGALKADVARVLWDRLVPDKQPHLFLGLTGVNNISQLKSEVDACASRGVRRILVCVDMDYRGKKEVHKAMERIIDLIQSCSLPDGTPVEAQMFVWDEKYKGIDDFLLSKCAL